MKHGALNGILKFVLTLGFVVLFELYFFPVLARFGLKFAGNAHIVGVLIRSILELMFTLLLYKGEIFAGKSKFTKSLITSVIISLVTFIVMVVFTVLVKKILGNFNIQVTYGFTNYFNGAMTFDRALEMIISCFINPCLICAIFVLGISDIIRKEYIAMIIAGIGYGVYLAFMKHIPLDMSLLYLSIEMVNVIALTYLYKQTGNIFTCIFTYVIYFLFGSTLLNYIV